MERRIHRYPAALFAVVVAAASLAVATVTLAPADPAEALGSRTWSCSYGPGGSVTGRSDSGGGWTSRTTGCTASVSVALQYNAYPGSPLYWTGTSYGSQNVTRYQSGTIGGEHCIPFAWCGYT